MLDGQTISVKTAIPGPFLHGIDSALRGNMNLLGKISPRVRDEHIMFCGDEDVWWHPSIPEEQLQRMKNMHHVLGLHAWLLRWQVPGYKPSYLYWDKISIPYNAAVQEAKFAEVHELSSRLGKLVQDLDASLSDEGVPRATKHAEAALLLGVWLGFRPGDSRARGFTSLR